MLTRLKIQNLILIDSADIFFGSGLNIITGETGSGKSAVLSAIALIAGERADQHLVGKNGDIAIVEAALSNVAVCEEIEPPPLGEPLIIRREIHRSGKSRCFAADQQVTLSFLRKMASSWIDLADQSSAAALGAPDEQRKIVDAYGDAALEVKEFAISFAEEKEMEKRIEVLTQSIETRGRDLAWAEEDLALIDEAAWQNGDEEKLTQEHQILTHAQELQEKLNSVLSLLSESAFKKGVFILEKCAAIDPRLSLLSKQLKDAAILIDETERSLDSHLSKLETDPQKLAKVEERIQKIEQLKRRFGKTFEAVQEKKGEIVQKIHDLNGLELTLKSLIPELAARKKENVEKTGRISKKRREAAEKLSSVVMAELKTLNLEHAQFAISVKESPMSSYGSDEISFLFSANKGHIPIPMEECASGGEISRLYFAIKTSLGDKESAKTMVFDEIDSNVGGQTAKILGEKLRKMAQKKQVICVTHFVQVARNAEHHFAVAKSQQKERAVATIRSLSLADRDKEYERMLGILKK